MTSGCCVRLPPASVQEERGVASDAIAGAIVVMLVLLSAALVGVYVAKKRNKCKNQKIFFKSPGSSGVSNISIAGKYI